MYLSVSKISWFQGMRVKEYAPMSSEFIWNDKGQTLFSDIEGTPLPVQAYKLTVKLTYHQYRIPRIIKR